MITRRNIQLRSLIGKVQVLVDENTSSTKIAKFVKKDIRYKIKFKNIYNYLPLKPSVIKYTINRMVLTGSGINRRIIISINKALIFQDGDNVTMYNANNEIVLSFTAAYVTQGESETTLGYKTVSIPNGTYLVRN